MFHHFIVWVSSLSHFYLLVVLLFFSHITYLYCFNRVYPVVASGSIVMAIAVFLSYCIPHHDYMAFVILAASFELFIIWFYLVAGMMNAYSSDRLSFKFYDYLNFGAWVSGTVMVVLMFDEVEYTLHGFIVFLGIVASVLWVVYFVMMVKWFLLNISNKFHVPVDGTVLLAATSTQLIVLMLDAVFHNAIPMWFYQGAIGLGFVFYLIGFYAVFRYSLYARKRHLLAIWPNANCLYYGALAMTGVTIITLDAFSTQVIAILWWLSAICFLLVELLEIVRLIIRIKMKGIVSGIWVYDTSQWFRVFSFGIFYALTFLCYSQQYVVNALVYIIANGGQYFVAFLLLVEIVLATRFTIGVDNEIQEDIL